VVCELNLATIQLITVNLLNIFHKHHTNYTFSIVYSIKYIFSKISVVVIIRTAVMCKLNFIKIIKLFIFNIIYNLKRIFL